MAKSLGSVWRALEKGGRMISNIIPSETNDNWLGWEITVFSLGPRLPACAQPEAARIPEHVLRTPDILCYGKRRTSARRPQTARRRSGVSVCVLFTSASSNVFKTNGLVSAPVNLGLPFRWDSWWLPREARRMLNGEPGKLRLAWN